MTAYVFTDRRPCDPDGTDQNPAIQLYSRSD